MRPFMRRLAGIFLSQRPEIFPGHALAGSGRLQAAAQHDHRQGGGRMSQITVTAFGVLRALVRRGSASHRVYAARTHSH